MSKKIKNDGKFIIFGFFSLQIYKDILHGETQFNANLMSSGQKGVFSAIKPANPLDEKAVLHKNVMHLEHDVT